MSCGHTPGPWQANVGENGHVSTIDGYAIADCCLDYSSIEHMKKLSNARLIAATPDLLAALRDCVQVMQNDLKGLAVIQPELRGALAAIHKATGETP